MYRVVGWAIVDGKYDCWIEDDFPDRKAAVACVDGLVAAGANSATVFNDRGNNVYTVNPSTRRFLEPTSVTKLAGLTREDGKPKRGTHRRK